MQTTATPAAQISATIATLDRPDALARCLDALLSGSVLPAEVVIVDQSQNDATQSVVEMRRRQKVPIVYIRQARRGLSVSRNTALAQVSYSIVAVTDDDCLPDPGWISAIAHTFGAEPALDALTGRVLPLGPETPDTYAVAVRESLSRQDFVGKTLPWIIGGGNNFAVKRDWFERVGGCDEHLGVGSPGKAAEDVDLFYRLLREGAKIRYEPDVLVYHERTSKARRLATRWSYGFGIGVFCSLWLRRRDLYALRVLIRWLRWQCRDFTVATVRREWPEAYQRWLSLKGTVGGLTYGLSLDSVEHRPRRNTTADDSGTLRSLP
jgi:glycosyltransferase involved in cell wall biosynthesis